MVPEIVTQESFLYAAGWVLRSSLWRCSVPCPPGCLALPHCCLPACCTPPLAGFTLNSTLQLYWFFFIHQSYKMGCTSSPLQHPRIRGRKLT